MKSGRDRRSTSRDTPAIPPATNKTSKEKLREKTFMEQWVEPTVAKAPSYADHNGGPYGVLEHMQPLGEAPNAKMKARVKSEAPRKSLLGRSAAAATGQDGAQETPEGTPAPPAETEPAANGSAQPTIVIDDEKDADYAPKGKKKEIKSSSSRKDKPQGDSVPPSKSRMSKTPRQSQTPSAAGVSRKRYDPEQLRRVVESAKERAMEVNKPDLADAVHEIWVESLRSERLADLLEGILLQTATPDQALQFQGYVKAAKRRLKDAKQKARNPPAEGANSAQARPLRSPSNSKATPSAGLHTAALPSTEPPEVPKAKLKLRVKSPQKESKRARSSHGGKMAVSPSKKRSGGDESDTSELTDLTENEHEDDAMDVDAPDDIAKGTAGPSTRVKGLTAKDHAAERGSLAAPDRKLKRSSAEADIEDDEQQRIITAKKLKFAETVNRDYTFDESHIRERPTRSSRAAKGLVPPPVNLEPNGSRINSRRSSRAVSGDQESPLTDVSGFSSRMSTPQQHVPKMPVKMPGKKAKTKTSPEKKHLPGYGGLSGAGGADRESPIGDDDNEEASENNDFCSACGGSGYLLCCDGCDRSFHFACLDPPLSQEASELNEPWYCWICIAKRPVAVEQPEKPASGLFAPLLSSLKKCNPSNFLLPEELRERDQYVHTGKDGSFTEAVNPKTRGRTAYDEMPDYFKVKDSKNSTVLCYGCSGSSLGHRPIIQCDYCNESWHLDCLDPPLANPPARTLEGKKIHDWMCPLHIDHELRHIDVSMLAPRRKVHLRRPKNARVVESALTRGFRNTGIIDVAEDESDDSDSEFYDEYTPQGGVVYRMPASGIKLDFIDKIKSTRIQAVRSDRVHKKARLAASTPSALLRANFARRSFVEKQLALNLTQFAGANDDLDLGKDRVENLVGTLIAEAPEDVVNGFIAAEETEQTMSSATAVPPSPPSSDKTEQLTAEQRKELQMLQELIRRRLEGSKA